MIRVPATVPGLHKPPSAPGCPGRPGAARPRWWASLQLFWLPGSRRRRGRGGSHRRVPSENTHSSVKTVRTRELPKVNGEAKSRCDYLPTFGRHAVQVGVRHRGLSLHLPLGHHVTPDDGHPLLQHDSQTKTTRVVSYLEAKVSVSFKASKLFKFQFLSYF